MHILNLPEEILMDLGFKSAKRLQYLKRIYGLTHSLCYHFYNKYYMGNLDYLPETLPLNDSAIMIQATNNLYNELKERYGPESIEWITRVFDTEGNPKSSVWVLKFKDSKKHAEASAAQRKVMLNKLKENL
jgi:hypothetical protein